MLDLVPVEDQVLVEAREVSWGTSSTTGLQVLVNVPTVGDFGYHQKQISGGDYNYIPNIWVMFSKLGHLPTPDNRLFDPQKKALQLRSLVEF